MNLNSVSIVFSASNIGLNFLKQFTPPKELLITFMLTVGGLQEYLH